MAFALSSRAYVLIANKGITLRRLSSQRPIINLMFVYEKDGRRVPIQALVGQSILEAAHRSSVDLEGACEASLACSTCHVVLEDEHFRSLDEAVEEEEDMLDLAVGLTATSRLGCQVLLRAIDDGRTVGRFF